MSEEQKAAPSSNEMRAFAYRLLGMREYSLFELAQRIHRKWPEAEGISELVETLADENLVSDERYVASFLRSRIQRHQGPLKIKAALRTKGVSDGLISRELEKYSGEWATMAREWLERRHSGPFDFDEKKKYYRRLKSRGFTHTQSMDALS